MQEYLKLLSFLVSNEDHEDYEYLLIKLKGLFLSLNEEMDIDLFYLSKKYLMDKCPNYGIEIEAIEVLDKEIHSMDEYITKLQIPRITFMWNKIESNISVYTKESDLYYDIRKILLNKDKYVRNYKPIINYYLSLIIETLESNGNISEYGDNATEVYQFEELIRLSKLMLSNATITPNNHTSLTMNINPMRISKIAEKY